MKQKKVTTVVLFSVLCIVVLIVNWPIITMILNSFKSKLELDSTSSIWPINFTLENYEFVTTRANIMIYFKNSFYVSGVSMLVSIFVASLAGYAISRYRSLSLSLFSKSLLMLQMFPIILVLIPIFILFKYLQLIDTHFSIILLYITGNLPFAIWMFKGFIDSIPKELEEASWIDGCSRFGSMVRIILPISGPGIAAIAIFSFLGSWNEFIIANIFLKSRELLTMSVGLQQFIQQYETDWGKLTAYSTLGMIPVLLMLLFLQKYMVQGSIAGSVKG